ncbi:MULTISPECIES: enoyl-CoA hydratase/isomerase family protein [Rhodococcus]|jgi:2-(1,2-epoxy-1,2-dihydrophenyl)acetyl-CoA isomerase|uniref:enoyl-CoA hydratase/isomerase family protein n=1 Tax=Rhodococcus TaxID=1827 RepID=UPI000B3C33B9|nr:MULTISPECIES: enoyl-CoA hydratase/isomerase family protein [Rhodococcus]MBV6755086.1 enoyl-CoA hydratase/isomerase family protein [Rhodococcus opacus]OUS91610.1 enoyl-CoA hydratase [Rhodococcus sp. NCIMB 12038]
MLDTESCSVEIIDGIGHITLNQPARGNPFDLCFNTELSLIATEMDENPEVRCVLLDANGKYFSVGADLKTMTRDQAELPRFIKNATAGLHMALSRFARMDAPLVVAVHALAVGGSVALSAAADFCIAARSAKFYAAYTGIGLVPDGGGTTFIPHRVGVRRAMELLMRNETWTSEQACEYGLINYVVDDDRLTDEAWALARELACGPTLAFGEIKNLLQSTWEQPIEAQMEREARAMVRVTKSEDGWNAVQSVLSKQKPAFHGR